jgi:hypothetical protein
MGSSWKKKLRNTLLSDPNVRKPFVVLISRKTEELRLNNLV